MRSLLSIERKAGSPHEMSDRELETIRRKKLLELKRQLQKKEEPKIDKERAETTREILSRFFVGRAWEVFNAANDQYPEATSQIEKTLAKLINEGKITSQISGEELYGLFRHLGLRVRLQIRIQVLEHGKIKSLEDKIKEQVS
jgi:DNA-binding TFAR19-related protein (PDSD5 family)